MARLGRSSLQEKHGAPGVKQQLAAVRMLFDWLVTGQVVPMNPAAAVRGPKHVVKTGKTPVLDGAEWRKLIDSIPTETVRDLRDRALIATLTYSFARITAALRMKVEDLRPKGAGWQIRLHEKGGKQHAMPCHHALAEALRAYIDAAGIAEDRKGWLFRTSPRHNATVLTEQPMAQADAWRMIRRRAAAAGIHGADRQSHVSGDRHHRLSRQWRRARARAVDGRAREPAHDKALRPHEGTAHAGRGGADQAVIRGKTEPDRSLLIAGSDESVRYAPNTPRPEAATMPDDETPPSKYTPTTPTPSQHITAPGCSTKRKLRLISRRVWQRWGASRSLLSGRVCPNAISTVPAGTSFSLTSRNRAR